ncbi:MAG: lysylphosphatidylglycerol synthase transmembrane domain-containing protein [Caldilineaceae bacterium]
MTRQNVTTFLKFAVGIGLIVFLFTRLEDPAALWAQIASANKWLLLLGTLCYTAAVAVSGLKWGLLLHAVGIPVPASKLLSYQWQAEFFNNFLPGQVGGDVARGYALAVDTRRTADAAASVLIDRFIGLLVFMLFAAVSTSAMLLFGRPDGTPFTPEQYVSLRLIEFGTIAISLFLLGALLTLVSRRLKALVERMLVRLPMAARTVPVWQKAAIAFDAYRPHAWTLVWVALCSAAIVLLTSVNIWLIANAIEPGGISFLEVLVVNPMIVFVGLALPLAPGGLGVRQGAFALTFLLVGAGAALGLAVGISQPALGYLVSLPGGILWIRGSRKRGAAVEPPATPSSPAPVGPEPAPRT